VEAAVEELDTTVRHIRTVIFDVEAARDRGSLRRRVMDVTREMRGSLGFQPHAAFNGPVDTAIPDAVADDLLATLREALANVARHAGATSAAVEVDVLPDAVRLRVGDDGVGPGTASRPGGNGVSNMHNRAKRHGGACNVSNGPDGGTLVEWTVPATATA
jgi:signal transduction histidine kinase